eukprot:15457349-Alexandrium_andersonii.AAC.1
MTTFQYNLRAQPNATQRCRARLTGPLFSGMPAMRFRRFKGSSVSCGRGGGIRARSSSMLPSILVCKTVAKATALGCAGDDSRGGPKGAAAPYERERAKLLGAALRRAGGDSRGSPKGAATPYERERVELLGTAFLCVAGLFALTVARQQKCGKAAAVLVLTVAARAGGKVAARAD